MNSLVNLDLLSVGVMVAVTIILGFTVYFNNRKSITNKLFLALSLDFSAWGIINYFAYQFTDINVATTLIRIVLFTATIQSLILLEFFLVLPNENYVFSKINKYIYIPVGVVVSALTLTRYVFLGSLDGKILGNNAVFLRGSAWLLFVLFSGGSIIIAIIILFKKIYKTKTSNNGMTIIFVGLVITYIFILNFNLILPMVFHNTQYIILGSLFMFPFIACTTYAILKHNLFKLKVTETMLMAIALLIISFVEVVFSNSVTEVIFRSCVFLFSALFVVLILKVVVREVGQRKEIKELTEVKSSLISLARHNIANPLTALKGYVSIFQEEMVDETSQRKLEMLDAVGRVTDNLVSIIMDFLDVSKLDDGHIKYSFSKTDLETLIEEILERYKQKIALKNINLIYNRDEDGRYIIRADREKLFHAVGNIIENSIKYTKEGNLNIDLSSDKKKISLKISDTGIRILPSTPPKLLEKFSPTRNKEEADIVTSGLGLYFTKQVIKAHGGDFHIESNKEGTETSFYIELPINF